MIEFDDDGCRTILALIRLCFLCGMESPFSGTADSPPYPLFQRIRAEASKCSDILFLFPGFQLTLGMHPDLQPILPYWGAWQTADFLLPCCICVGPVGPTSL